MFGYHVAPLGGGKSDARLQDVDAHLFEGAVQSRLRGGKSREHTLGAQVVVVSAGQEPIFHLRQHRLQLGSGFSTLAAHLEGATVLVSRLAQGSHKQPFSGGAMGHETIDGQVALQAAANVPRLINRHGNRHGSQLIDHKLHLLLVFVHVECARAVDQQTAGLQSLPHVTQYLTLQAGAVAHLGEAPIGNGTFVFAKHAFARTGHVGQDYVKRVAQLAESCSRSRGDGGGGCAPLCHIFRQDAHALAVYLIADEAAAGREHRLQRRAFATGGSAEIQAGQRCVGGEQ